MEKILIFRTSALGDVVMALPLFHALQQTYPKAQITWVIDKNVFPLISHLPNLNFIKIQKPQNFQEYFSLTQQFSKHYDVLLATQMGIRSNLIYPLVKAPLKVGMATLQDLHSLFVNHHLSRKTHLVDTYMEFAKFLNCSSKVDLHLPLPLGNFPAVKPPYIVINPGASSSHRVWPIQSTIDVIERINKTFPHKVVLTGAPCDLPLGQKISSKVDCLNLMGKTSLPELIHIINKASLVIAPDTGVLHLANSVHTPLIGLYACYPPEKTGPYGQISSVLNYYPLAKQKFGNMGLRVNDARAMGLISGDKVWEKILETL